MHSTLADDGVPIDEDELNDFATKLQTSERKWNQVTCQILSRASFRPYRHSTTGDCGLRIRGPVVFVEARFTAMSVSAQKAGTSHPTQDEPTVRNKMQRLSGFWEWVDKLDKVERALAAAESLKEKLLPLGSGIMDQL
jgi:hypothetical protein